MGCSSYQYKESDRKNKESMCLICVPCFCSFIGNQSLEHIQGENLLKSNHGKYYSYMIPLSENMVRALRNIEA